VLKRYVKALAVVLLFCLFVLPQVVPAVEKSGSEAVSIPADATPAQVKEILAGMSDEQVRRLLIAELQKGAAQSPAVEEHQGLAGAIVRGKQLVQQVHERFSHLLSGAAEAPRLLPVTLQSLTGNGAYPPGQLGLGLGAITLMWFLACWLVGKRTDRLRVRIEDVSRGASLPTRLGRLFARAGFDLLAVLVITLITLIPYLVLFNEPATGRPVIFAWLGAMFTVELVRLVARFILAPNVGVIRFLPLSDETACYLYKWVLRLAWVVAFGMLLSSLVRMTRGSELLFLLILSMTGFIVAVTISLVALWNKNRVADTIRGGAVESSLKYQLAGAWHVSVIVYVMGFWLFWVVALLVFGEEAMLAGVGTLLIVPGCFLADWATQRLVTFAVDLAAPRPVESDEDEPEGSDTGEPVISKFQRFLSSGFRILIFAASTGILLRIWGLDIPVGRATIGAGIDILLTLVLAYIFWVFISNYIERKLRENQPDGPDDSGEGGGGPGGDRLSTLLHLVKKFIFAGITVITVLIVLSSLGVDIGPLIAGASVFGIAIGFGAQTLVKDIISGIFFLMDDAFRVGDYIEVGKAMGTVEEISVRSFKLRHHLGMLYTIPFGSIKDVKNMSRDWSIMKLKYLVPFDTDIQQVKKIIKSINKEIRAIPELDEMMLSDIKSQGVKAMEEYGMRMRVKFMTKPGGQFTLRKLVLAKMRKKFEEAGIEFAKPRVSVHVPGEQDFTEQEAQAAAAASSLVDKTGKGHGTEKGK